MIYYISDLHFNSSNYHDGRTKEHDKIIKENWNKKVTNADTVYILGDVGMTKNVAQIEYVCELISTLKGDKKLIVGNHDTALLKDLRFRQLFSEICDYKEISYSEKGKNYNVILSHYPIFIWNGQHKKKIHIYGHVHTSEEWKIYEDCLKNLNKYFEKQTKNGRTDCPKCYAYNVGAGVDYMGYTPKSMAEIIEESSAEKR